MLKIWPYLNGYQLERNGIHVLKTAKRTNEWPLKWWTDRMSIPQNIVQEIVELIKNNKKIYNKILRIEKEFDGKITKHPYNDYLLGIKI